MTLKLLLNQVFACKAKILPYICEFITDNITLALPKSVNQILMHGVTVNPVLSRH